MKIHFVCWLSSERRRFWGKCCWHPEQSKSLFLRVEIRQFWEVCCRPYIYPKNVTFLPVMRTSGCKFYNSATDSIWLDPSFVRLQAATSWAKSLKNSLRCRKRVTKFIVTICWLRKRQWQVKERRQIQEITLEKYYNVHLVSSVLPLTATTHFLPDRIGNDTGNLNRKSPTCKWPIIRLP